MLNTLNDRFAFRAMKSVLNETGLINDMSSEDVDNLFSAIIEKISERDFTHLLMEFQAIDELDLIAQITRFAIK